MAHGLNPLFKSEIDCTTTTTTATTQTATSTEITKLTITNSVKSELQNTITTATISSSKLSSSFSELNLPIGQTEVSAGGRGGGGGVLVVRQGRLPLSTIATAPSSSSSSPSVSSLMSTSKKVPSIVNSGVNNNNNNNSSSGRININNNSNSINNNNNSNIVTSSSNTGNSKMGSRRIFPPEFKLRVLESYYNDSECKGNQRATARKYGIHRRQIQKWLQSEKTLRSSVASSYQKHQFHNVTIVSGATNPINTNNNVTSCIGSNTTNTTPITSTSISIIDSSTNANQQLLQRKQQHNIQQQQHHHQHHHPHHQSQFKINLLSLDTGRHSVALTTSMPTKLTTRCVNGRGNVTAVGMTATTTTMTAQSSILSTAVAAASKGPVASASTTTPSISVKTTIQQQQSPLIVSPPLLNANSASTVTIPSITSQISTITSMQQQQQQQQTYRNQISNNNSNASNSGNNIHISTPPPPPLLLATLPPPPSQIQAPVTHLAFPIIQHSHHMQQQQQQRSHNQQHHQYQQQQQFHQQQQQHHHNIPTHIHHGTYENLLMPSACLPCSGSPVLTAANQTNELRDYQPITATGNCYMIENYRNQQQQQQQEEESLHYYTNKNNNNNDSITPIDLSLNSCKTMPFSLSPSSSSSLLKMRTTESRCNNNDNPYEISDNSILEGSTNRINYSISTPLLTWHKPENYVQDSVMLEENAIVVDLTCHNRRKRENSSIDDNSETQEYIPQKLQKIEMKTMTLSTLVSGDDVKPALKHLKLQEQQQQQPQQQQQEQQQPQQELEQQQPQKPVKLFKPYLLDNEENDSDDNNNNNNGVGIDKIKNDEKKSKYEQDPIIWSHHPSCITPPTHDVNTVRGVCYNSNSSIPQTITNYTTSSNFQSTSSTNDEYTFPTDTKSTPTAIFQSSLCRATSMDRISPRTSPSSIGTIASVSSLSASSSPTIFWCPKGSPVSGYDSASTYSESSSDYYYKQSRSSPPTVAIQHSNSRSHIPQPPPTGTTTTTNRNHPQYYHQQYGCGSQSQQQLYSVDFKMQSIENSCYYNENMTIPSTSISATSVAAIAAATNNGVNSISAAATCAVDHHFKDNWNPDTMSNKLLLFMAK